MQYLIEEMAARNEDLAPETGRDLCRVRRDGERRGYRKDILTDNLSERDTVFICVRCQEFCERYAYPLMENNS